ncbi:MAG: hypothetical protein WC969_05975 [Elusimicrobiota bacterium]|jgi:hypothetical protein
MSKTPEPSKTSAPAVLTAGAEYLRDAHASLAKAQDMLVEAAREAPEKLRGELESLNRRMGDSKARFDEHVESFREKYLKAQPTEDEFRAHLVMLEMEYSSRLRVAETGFRLLFENLEKHMVGVGERVRGLVQEANDAFGERMYPVHAQLLEMFTERDKLVTDVWNKRVEALEEEWARKLEEEREARAREQGPLEARSRELAERAGALEARLEDAEAASRRFAQALEEERSARAQQLIESERLSRELEHERTRPRTDGVVPAAAEAEALRRQLEDNKREIARLKAQVEEDRKREETRVSAGSGEAAKRIERTIADFRKQLQVAHEDMGKVASERDMAQRAATRAERSVAVLKAQHEEAEEGLRKALAEKARGREEVRHAEQETQLLRDELRAMRQRMLSASGRDAGKDEEAAAAWSAEKEELLEKFTLLQAELNALRILYDQSQQTWMETMVRQDTKRLDEIYKLRTELQALRASRSLTPKDEPEKPPLPPSTDDPNP